MQENKGSVQVEAQRAAIIFGGTGFIGSFFARHLLDNENYSRVYLVDLQSLDEKLSTFRRDILGFDERVIFARADVRFEINWTPDVENIDLIANFAAVHREPGHHAQEYFDCNIKGAENVCEFANRIGCNSIVFTSSISPYGVSEDKKDEETLPVPVSAYGASKLVAEKIHKEWLASNGENRLLIVRPGVVFGPGEGGNVSRLIKAVKGGYFFYMSNKATKKAGIYVREVCNAICWLLERVDMSEDRYLLANLSMDPAPSIEDYVKSIKGQLGRSSYVFNIPRPFLFCISYSIFIFSSVFRMETPFDPVRLRKTIRSNNIKPTKLMSEGYEFRYELDDAMRDWREISPEDWT